MKLGESINLQFRTEFFNITNHPSFALPSNIRAAANFGALFTTPDAAQNNVGLGWGAAACAIRFEAEFLEEANYQCAWLTLLVSEQSF